MDVRKEVQLSGQHCGCGACRAGHIPGGAKSPPWSRWFTTDSLLSQRLADGWQVEHLEAFGVAYACEQKGIPFALILGISNVVGPDAHLEWLAHRDKAQNAARDAAMRTIGTSLSG